jgi:hypothetical protein
MTETISFPRRLTEIMPPPNLYARVKTRYGGPNEFRRRQMSDDNDEHKPVRAVLWARALLILPFIAMLWVSSYNSVDPMIAGVPFFYWYQLLWILIGAMLIVLVYAVER